MAVSKTLYREVEFGWGDWPKWAKADQGKHFCLGKKWRPEPKRWQRHVEEGLGGTELDWNQLDLGRVGCEEDQRADADENDKDMVEIGLVAIFKHLCARHMHYLITLHCPLEIWGNGGTKSSNNLPKVTQLLSDRASIQTQAQLLMLSPQAYSEISSLANGDEQGVHEKDKFLFWRH